MTKETPMDMDNERGRKDEEEAAPAAKTGSLMEKLKLVAHYVMLGFAPVASLLALIFAVMAYTGNQSNRAQLNEANARITSLSVPQYEPKGELDIFNVSLAHEKALLADERKKQVEQDAKIVANVTQLQVKLKVSPTLEEQLRGDAKAPVSAPRAASAPVAASSVTVATPVVVPAPAVVPVPVIDEKKPVVQPAAKPAVAEKKPAPVAKVIKEKPAPAPTSAEKAAKAKALKKTIEDFNKGDRK
jgi:hypothetical protein